MEIIINLTPEEKQALEFDLVDMQFLAESQLEGRINLAKQKIVDLTVREAIKNNVQLPTTEQGVIALGFSKGWAMSKQDYLASLAAAEKQPAP
jgi:hypothetical protein